MSEYISREAAINKIMENIVHQDSHDVNLHNIGLRKAMSAIDSLPGADVVPVRHGTWIKADEQPYFRKHYHAKVCSECGKRKDGKWLYCPYCGSKNQDGGQDE